MVREIKHYPAGSHQTSGNIKQKETDSPLHNTSSHCGNVRYNTHLYCLAVQAGFYSDAVECLTVTQEILVRSSAGTKVV